MPLIRRVLAAVFAGTLATLGAHAERLHGFDISNASIPASEILSGGPGRDGIPALDRPRFVPARRVRFLTSDDQVLSVSVGGVTRVYPLRILVWHEVVNDTLSAQPIAVTYCPLCGTAMVFDRRIGERTLTFGVSGLLYQSDMLMYDRETESLWSQLSTRSISGPLVGSELVWLPSVQLTWEAWKKQNRTGEVLTTDTGFRRDYGGRRPYVDYETREATMFPVPHYRDELRNKAWVAGIVVNGEAAAYSMSQLSSRPVLEDTVGGIDVRIEYDPASRAVRVVAVEDGEVLPVVKVYWFAWQAFHPETRLWEN